jgi:hypothetical protein
VKDIADVPYRMPGTLNAVVRIVGFTCGDNNLKTISAIRKAATTPQLRDRIDAVYKHAEARRKSALAPPAPPGPKTGLAGAEITARNRTLVA